MPLDRINPWRILLPVAVGTCLSLVGDSSLYAVLPTHTQAAGVSVASVGILLSANRFIRLVLNGPAGIAYDRFSRRRLFVSSLFIGALSTAIYALTHGFWPLLFGRLLWGLAWSGIWVGGNTIILDISNAKTRGRWMGIYQFSFFLGSATGSILGGTLTDQIGFNPALMVGAGLTLTGAVIALIFLPETQTTIVETDQPLAKTEPDHQAKNQIHRGDFSAITVLYSVNRLVIPGILSSTLGIFLLQQLGEQFQIGGRILGVATLTGYSLGFSTLVAMVSAFLSGWISDRVGNRWRSAAGGLLPGMAGFLSLSLGLPAAIFTGIPLIAMTSGSNQGLATALIGDLGDRKRQSRRLGLLFTAGDLMSAIGPPLAYALINFVELNLLYLVSAGFFGVVFFVVLQRVNLPNSSDQAV